MARKVGDPALFVRVAATLLEFDGDDGLARDAAASVQQILLALPDETMRRQFAEAQPVRLIHPVHSSWNKQFNHREHKEHKD
ncbi:MAG: hypothetical protein FJ398_11585 [Verrucomicrobia bacterium]|nr:hypothetical protein [Verrucomicrobiota bacterium]